MTYWHSVRLGSVLLCSCLLSAAAVAGNEFCRSLGIHAECEEDGAIPNCYCACFNFQEKPSVTTAYFGEFGYELWMYTPYAYHLHKHGVLDHTIGPPGSAPLYYFSKDHKEVEHGRHPCGGTFRNRGQHPQPGQFDDTEWVPPPFKEHYKPKGKALLGKVQAMAGNGGKPLLIVHNKYTNEWDGPPVNFIDVPTLLSLFKMLTPHYTCVYIRPVHNQHLAGYAFDFGNQHDFKLDDYEQLTRANLGVVFFHDLHHAHPELAYNELLFQLHAQGDYFVSVLGGNALISSYFASINLIFATHAFPSPANEMHHYNIPELNGSSYEYHVMYPKLVTGLQEVEGRLLSRQVLLAV
ncbi:hypothetical protein WJX73_003298 [Symbiochloris irregularis]|uniref:Uncharacterized protein n=1 Tax=Symbiochloris irregularis TaxID=706552 RepID=A0AAW1PVA8_9CHLO